MGDPPYPLVTMVMIRLRLPWHNLSEPVMEDALIEFVTIRHLDLYSQLSPSTT